MNFVEQVIDLYLFIFLLFKVKLINITILYTYILVLCLLIVRSSALLIFVTIETLSWLIVILLLEEAFKYLLVQRFFIVVGLFRIIRILGGLFIVLLIKLRLPPFHNWIVQILIGLKTKSFLFATTIHKLSPFLFLASLFYISEWIFLGTISLIIRIIIITRTITIIGVLVVSSLVNSRWILLRIIIMFTLGVSYWLIYTLLFYRFTMRFTGIRVIFNSLKQRRILVFFWLLRSGIPPFLFFWLKLQIIINLTFYSNFFIWRLLTLLTLSFAAYYRIYSLSKSPRLTIKYSIIPFFATLRFLTF